MTQRYVDSHDENDILSWAWEAPEHFRDGYSDAILHHNRARCFLADAFEGRSADYAAGYQAACRELFDRGRETEQCVGHLSNEGT